MKYLDSIYLTKTLIRVSTDITLEKDDIVMLEGNVSPSFSDAMSCGVIGDKDFVIFPLIHPNGTAKLNVCIKAIKDITIPENSVVAAFIDI